MRGRVRQTEANRNLTEVRIARGVPGITAAWVKKIVAGTLRSEKANWALSVYLTGDREIRRINRKHLNHDYATDVISFDLGDRQGDIVVSAEMARRTAKELKIPFRQELARYLIHGALHLLGYDDKSKADKKTMFTAQERVLSDVMGRGLSPRKSGRVRKPKRGRGMSVMSYRDRARSGNL